MHGVVVIDKPAGRTSFDVVRRIRGLCGAAKAGHAGTLDPLATGVLPVFVNEATKLMQFFSHDDKEYRATVLLGVETDTLDVEGRVTAERSCDVTAGEVTRAVEALVGRVRQQPPRYSAVKHRGKPLYVWARKGVHVEVEPRTVEIYRINVLEVALPLVRFSVACSKGTYVRSLCEDLGRRLGCGACLFGLRRTRCGRFREDEALVLEERGDREYADLIQSRIIPIADALGDFPAVPVTAIEAEKIQQGLQPDCEMLEGRNIPSLSEGDMVKFVTENYTVVAVAEMLVPARELPSMDKRRQAVRIVRVFNT